MGLAQVTEILAMFSLAAWLNRWGTKAVLGAGLAFAVLRYVLLPEPTCATSSCPASHCTDSRSPCSM